MRKNKSAGWRSNGNWFAIKWIFSVTIILGCAATSIAMADSVRTVDYRRTPDLQLLAVRAREIGNEVYPKMLTLLGDDQGTVPEHFDIIFKEHLNRLATHLFKMEVAGLGYHVPFCTPKVRLYSFWLSQNPEELDRLLVHEIGHIAEDYKWYRWYKIPDYWAEGIPDYLCFKLGYTNGWRCPECSLEFPDYTAGYTCAGAFLIYIDGVYGAEVVTKLNRELRRGTYTDGFFFTTTGKTLDELWAEFKHSAAFTPFAAKLNAFHEALGYVKGRPPRDVWARLEVFLKQHTSGVEAAHQLLGYQKGRPPSDVLKRCEMAIYMAATAGVMTQAAGELLLKLKEAGRLPGLSKNDELTLTVPENGYAEAYPISRTFHGSKKGEACSYNYRLVQASKESPWKLQRAWKTGNGRILEEFSLTTP